MDHPEFDIHSSQRNSMEIRWTKAAHGFHHATYPNKKYRLSANLIEKMWVDGKLEERISYLGRVDVEEKGDGSLNFLFGSQLAFWPEVNKKLQEMEISPENVEKVIAFMATTVPLPPKDQPRPRILRGVSVG